MPVRVEGIAMDGDTIMYAFAAVVFVFLGVILLSDISKIVILLSGGQP